MSNAPFLCLVWALTDPPPGIPGVGGPGSPGGIWGGGPHPMPPIHHPGHPDHGKPVDPGFGVGGGPVDPGFGHTPGHPANRPPGSWTGNRPGHELPEPPPGGTDVPEDVYQPAPVPEEIASQYIVSVYDPKTMEWTTKSYPPPGNS